MDVEKAGADVFRVTGRVARRLELECGRCLEPFEIPVDAPFELRYVPQTENSGEGEREIAEDDLTTAFYREGVAGRHRAAARAVSAGAADEAAVQRGVPGLCSVCGANLNRTDCECTPRWEDPRLAALKGLLDRQKEN